MSLKACEIQECGAKVKVISIQGLPVAVNPRKMELIVKDDYGDYRRVSGFEPHHYTCINIGDRLTRSRNRHALSR